MLKEIRDELAVILIPAELQNHLSDVYKYRFISPHQTPRIRLFGSRVWASVFCITPLSHLCLLGQVRKPCECI